MKKVSRTSRKNQISREGRKSLETEYQVAHQMFQQHNSQAWQTFSLISTISLAGLAFIGQLKDGNKITWPTTIAVGLGMIVILIGWLMLANRWWSYSRQVLFRMREIEKVLGMYLVREGTWLREKKKDLVPNDLTPDELSHYYAVREAFKRFPSKSLNQQVLTTIIVGAMILIWTFFVVADILSLI